MTERKVPVAYVTKYVETRGIIVVRDASVWTGSVGGEYIRLTSCVGVGPREWTEDKAEAEKRYKTSLLRKIASANKRLSELNAMFKAAPKYEEGK